jgi:hypothetical protein
MAQALRGIQDLHAASAHTQFVIPYRECTESRGKDAEPCRPRPLDSGFPAGMTVETVVCAMACSMPNTLINLRVSRLLKDVVAGRCAVWTDSADALGVLQPVQLLVEGPGAVMNQVGQTNVILEEPTNIVSDSFPVSHDKILVPGSDMRSVMCQHDLVVAGNAEFLQNRCEERLGIDAELFVKH